MGGGRRTVSELHITVPGTPVSVNHYKKPRRYGRGYYVTKEAEAFKQAIVAAVAGRSLSAKAFAVEVAFHLGNGQRGDVDNFAKCVLDGLVLAGAIHSDAAVTDLRLTKARDRERPRTEITVRAI
jgi:Holliday junction resolvase RusA-like endonuclease